MKKILSYSFALALLFSACHPMEDINKAIDDQNPITNINKDIAVTLTDADYEAMKGNVAKDHAFSASDPAKNYIPAFLKDLHPALTEGSVANITYKLKNDYPDLTPYTKAPEYELSDADYENASTTIGVAKYFSPLNPADKYLPSILNSAIPDAQDGDIYLVSYMYSDVEPKESTIQDVTIFSFDFTDDLGDFTPISITGDQVWIQDSYSGDGYAKMSGYAGGNVDNEDWLISPQIDLTGSTNTTFNVTQTAKYVNDKWDQLSIMISTDYNGTDPTSATWTTLTLPNLPTGNDWTYVNSGDVDLSAFDGEKIYIAMKYVSNADVAATWEITDLAVKGQKVMTTKSAKITDPIAIQEFYTYNSNWKKTSDAYYVTTPDFDSMGEGSGEPGQYNNFSSSINPDNYLPQLLQLKFPYGQEGDVMNVAYKYYSGEVKTYGDQYLVKDGMWQKYDPIVVKTDQFILANTNEWVFDPTVNYTMTTDDYQTIVDYVKTNIDPSHISSYGDSEDYFGTNAHYAEFQIGSTNFDHDQFATWQDAVKEAIGTAFLPDKFPNATAKVDGIDVNYKVTFAIYESGQMVNYVITFQCTKSGPNPEFTYVDGPTKE
ncbi:MAG TPA: choice-of-anchor J domain-containing protein [Sunxiuqinia sp.]|nr:choice-of-anchor J domain-containing protein [Sunxiuqinia sp.]